MLAKWNLETLSYENAISAPIFEYPEYMPPDGN